RRVARDLAQRHERAEVEAIALLTKKMKLANSSDVNEIARLVQAVLEVGDGVRPARHDEALARVVGELPEKLINRSRLDPLEAGERQHASLSGSSGHDPRRLRPGHRRG